MSLTGFVFFVPFLPRSISIYTICRYMCTQETEEQPRTRGRATTTMFRYYACMLSVETCNAIHRVVLRYVVHLLALPPPPRSIPSWPVVLRALTPSYAWLDDNNNTERGRERHQNMQHGPLKDLFIPLHSQPSPLLLESMPPGCSLVGLGNYGVRIHCKPVNQNYINADNLMWVL